MADNDFVAFARGFDPTGGALRVAQNLDAQRKLQATQAAGAAYARGDLSGARSILLSAGAIDDANALRTSENQNLTFNQGQQDRDTLRRGYTDFAAGRFDAAAPSLAAGGDLRGVEAAQKAKLDKYDRQKEFLGSRAQRLGEVAAKGDQAQIAAEADSLASDFVSQGYGTPDEAVKLSTQYKAAPADTAARLRGAQKVQHVIDPNSGDVIFFNESGDEVSRIKGSGPKRQDFTISTPNGDARYTYGQDGKPQLVIGPSDAPGSALGPAGQPAAQPYAARVRALESGGNDTARNGSSTGRYQFHPETFARYVPGGNINDPADQEKALVAERADQTRLLTPVLGRAPTDAEFYIAHQQGSGGGPALLANPSKNAVQALVDAGVAPSRAAQSIKGNLPPALRGRPLASITAGDFTNAWRDRYGEAPASSAQAGGALTYPITASGELTPQAIETIATVYGRTGQMPPIGYGAKATQAREKIFNKWAEIERATGATGEDAAMRWAERKADQSSLTDLTKRQGQILTFETTAAKNGQVLRDAIKTGAGQSGVPLLNRPIQWLRQNAAGDPAVARLNAALQTYRGEITKLLSGSTGSAAPSDSARHEIDRMFSDSSTPAQMLAAMDVLDQDAHNRRLSGEQEISAVKDRMRGGARGGKPSTNGVKILSVSH